MNDKSEEYKYYLMVSRYIQTYNSYEIVKAIADCFDIKKDELFKKQRGNVYRQLVLYMLKKHTALLLRKIGSLFGVDYIDVSASNLTPNVMFASEQTKKSVYSMIHLSLRKEDLDE